MDLHANRIDVAYIKASAKAIVLLWESVDPVAMYMPNELSIPLSKKGMLSSNMLLHNSFLAYATDVHKRLGKYKKNPGIQELRSVITDVIKQVEQAHQAMLLRGYDAHLNTRGNPF